MAKRHQKKDNATYHENANGLSSIDARTVSQLPQRHAASLGKLQEIDLGETATLRNLKRTEAAMRRANGEAVESELPPVSRKPRLGRNGKPRRGPKRRNSEDLARDRMVEHVLNENRLGIYNDEETERDPETNDGNADERLAEQFRQEFIESMQSRHKTRNPAPAKTSNDPLKGPKLGGSRSARAAMHRHLEAEAAQKK